MPAKNKKKRFAFFREVKHQWPFYAMMLPGIAFILIMFYLPMPGIVMAFKNYKPALGIFGSEWADPIYKNFIFFFKSDTAKTVTLNTIGYNVIQGVLTTVLSIAFAIMLNELTGKLVPGFYKGVLIIPTFLSWIVIQYVVYALLSVDRGIINNLIVHFGGTPKEWYSNPTYWRFIMPIAYLWKNVGYYCVLYVAAIAGIPTEHYEAARMDGATKWQEIWHITLPMLKPTIIVLSLLWVGKLFVGGLGDWNAYYALPNNAGALYKATDVIDTYVYRALQQINDYGMSAAVGLYQSTIGLVLVAVSNAIIKKIDPDSALF